MRSRLLKSGTRFDLVVTDIEMPDMDGFALAEAMRAHAGRPALPIIALSAMVSAEAIERGRAVGFHDFVAKFDRTGLIAAIKEQSADVNRGSVIAMNDNRSSPNYVTFTDRRPDVRPADRARAGRLQAVADHARAARRAGDRGRAQSARPDRHGYHI